MKITIVTLFEDILKGFFENSIMKRSIEKNLIEVNFVNFRDWAKDVQKSCDDNPYGGGSGMLLKPSVISQALDSIDAKNKKVVFATPNGKLFNQAKAYELSQEKELIFICGHYEGLDQRVIDEYVNECMSIGDYVISSGEVATLVIIDAVYRLIDNVLTPDSLDEESFTDGLLEYSQYTRPSNFRGRNVPPYLLSGNHSKISKINREERLKKTWINRPDLFIK